MADLPTNLRTFLLSRSAITAIVGAQVHQASIPADRQPPYVWFARTGSEAVDVLTPDVGLEPNNQFFTLECVTDDLDKTQALGDAIRAFNNYRSTFGDTTVQGVFVNEQNDDYEYRTIMGDEGFHTAAFSIEVYSN